MNPVDLLFNCDRFAFGTPSYAYESAMKLFIPTLFSSSHLIERLKSKGCHIYELSECYAPVKASISIHEPLSYFTPSARFVLRQWLIDSGPEVNISLQSGLLHLGSSCLYESNLRNQAFFQRTISSFFDRPPGFWHRYRSPAFIPQPLILLSSNNNPNYFHWMTQPGLAPLFLQEHFSLCPFPSAALSHRPGALLPPFLSDLLDVFSSGLSRFQGHALASNSVCRFSLQEHSTEVVVSPAQVHWLRRRCSDFLKPTLKPWRRIFISRARSRCRRCLNEDQILGHLEPYGFQAIFLEDLTVQDQLRIFSESVLVVGAHGAGFSNLIACTSQAAIIELLPKPGAFSHYYAMADVLGLSHGHLVATHFDSGTDDFTVSPYDLMDLLRKMKLL